MEQRMRSLFILRHGSYDGADDALLNNLGQEQMWNTGMKLQLHIKPADTVALLVSPKIRALHSGQIIREALSLPEPEQHGCLCPNEPGLPAKNLLEERGTEASIVICITHLDMVAGLQALWVMPANYHPGIRFFGNGTGVLVSFEEQRKTLFGLD